MTDVQPGDGRALRAYGMAPDAIMPLSLDRLRARSPVALPPEPASSVMLRMAYAAGDPDLLREVVAPADAVHATVAALKHGAPVICDVGMVAAGVRTLAERAGSAVLCAQEDMMVPGSVNIYPGTNDALRKSTRTARGLLDLASHWQDAIVIIGNAPTALLALLDALADGAPTPAAIIATPCGLVAAEESKQLLEASAPAPYITVRGTRGGSAVAAAAFNACAMLEVHAL